ncbi:ABC transporter ATP-binding protein [Planctomycetales bacterium ZRK34]|nr:ABC transporter ATP-binding protein [Planctomycetales bacterium ZRK34]
MPESPLLQIEDLAVTFDTEAGIVRAVNGVNLTIYPQQTLAVVGESGCGKSVSALSTLQLVPTPPGKFERGRILFDGDDLLRYSEKQMQGIRGNHIAMIFQEPMTSLNPVYTVGDQIMEAILLHQKVGRAQAKDIAEQALRDVGVADPRNRLDVYPHQMSGGMRQRVMIAMALACKPRLLLADEPTTALDVTIQAQILELLRKLQREHGMSIMLITHDLGVVAENADVVAVMYAGRVVEYGSVHDVFANPLHPYTRGLFRSIPKLGETAHRLPTIPGNVANPANLPIGCPFHPRCDTTRQCAAGAGNDPDTTVKPDNAESESERVMTQCTTDDPKLLEVTANHWVSCHFAEGYDAGRATRPDVKYRRPIEQPA